MPEAGRNDFGRCLLSPGRHVLLLTVLCSLCHGLLSPSAQAQDASPAGPAFGIQELQEEKCQGESLVWLESVASAWRQEYLTVRLTGSLFRQNPDTAQIDGSGEMDPGPFEEGAPGQADVSASQRSWEQLYRSGERYLGAGLFPEAAGEYERSLRFDALSEEKATLSGIGLVKATMGLGRLEEARRRLQELSARVNREEPVLALLEAVLACFAQDFPRASSLFMSHFSSWHLCPNLEAFAGYSLLREQRHEEAVRIFQLATQSGSKEVREFGTLGLGESLQALGRCAEAESIDALAGRDGSLVAILGSAELRMWRGDLENASGELRRLITSTDKDYWKGIAYAYLLALKQHEGKWSELLQTAREARALVLTSAWHGHLQEQTVWALEQALRELGEGGAAEDILLLAGQWTDCHPLLSAEGHRIIGKAYERLGLVGPALEVCRGFPDDPGALLEGARMAWMNEQYETALDFLKQYEKSGPQAVPNEARLLRGCLLFQIGSIEGAAKCLEGSREGASIAVLVGVGEVEVRLGMFDQAAEDYRAALEKGLNSPEEKRHVLSRMADLCYRQGKFSEAAQQAQMAAETSCAGAGMCPDPVGILAQLRLGQLGPARQQAGELAKGPDAALVQEIVAAQNLIETLQRNGYAP